MKANLATIPNLLTLLRILVLPLIAIFLQKSQGIFAASVLTFAALTDWLDGYLARKHQLETAFGKLMDPIADKLLLCLSVVFLVADKDRNLDPWLGTLLLAREMLITGLRAYVASSGIVMAAGKMGKYKALFQFIGLGCAMVGEEIPGLPARTLGVGILWFSVILSYVSMTRYTLKAYRELKASHEIKRF